MGGVFVIAPLPLKSLAPNKILWYLIVSTKDPSATKPLLKNQYLTLKDGQLCRKHTLALPYGRGVCASAQYLALKEIGQYALTVQGASYEI